MKIIKILFFPLRLVVGLLVLSVCTVLYGMGLATNLEDGFKETVDYILNG